MNYQQLKKIAAFYGRFTFSFSQLGFRARRPFWPAFKGEFAGENWLVTGGSGGLGLGIGIEAARRGAQVLLAARSPQKLAQVMSEAADAGIKRLDAAVCDFSLQSDTARFVREFAASGRKIDVLVNNVGVLNARHSLTGEGRETSFTTNCLSHYQLTEGLIRHGSFASNRPLVINMTSGGGYNVPLNTDMLNMLDPKTFNGTAAYGFHKRAQMALNRHWRGKYGPAGFTFYAMHPGWADTDGVKRSLPRFRKILRPILRDAASGGDTAIWLAATRPEQPDAAAVWFDRKARSAHMYRRTRVSVATPQTLVEYLERELARFAGNPP